MLKLYSPEWGAVLTKTPPEDSLIQIVETQTVLRRCIEKARQLTADSDRLIRRHKPAVESDAENPAHQPAIPPQS